MTQQQWGGQQPQGQFGGQFGSGQFGRTPQGWNQPTPGQGGFGQQGWQGQQPGGFGRPPRRNPMQRVLIAVIALVAAALVGLVVVNLIPSGNSNVAYQNDSYKVPPPDKNPPPLPQPETYTEAKQMTTANKIYDQTMPSPIRCELKPITEQSSDSELASHLNNLMACLVRAWEPAVTAAGYKITRPSVTIYGDSVTTKCGKAGGENAFYCAADQQVYYSRTLPEVDPSFQDSRWGPDLVLAHEFGHAIQARTGILISNAALEEQVGRKTDEGLEMNRRLEQQADCFSGLFLRSTSQSLDIKQSEVAPMEQIVIDIGDDSLSGDPTIEADHGHGASRLYWWRQGLGTSQITKCNTFIAPSDQVK